MAFLHKLKQKIISYVFIVSKQPVLFRDLLRSNVLFNEGMYVDPSLLNFRKNIAHVYWIYAAVCTIILVPFVILSHTIFIEVDFHIYIIATVVATSTVVMGFDAFNIWLRKSITHRLIQEAWAIHFPYFPYEKYSKKVEDLYNQARKKEVPKVELERYILDNLVK